MECYEDMQKETILKKRYLYIFLTLLLLIIEVLIALFVHDQFVRPYIGDVLVVVLLYTFIRIFIPEGVRLLPFYIFIFAAGVEVLQYFRIVEVLGLQNSTFFRILMGSVADIHDVVCYGIGCILLALVEKMQQGKGTK